MRVPVQTNLLRWARERSGHTPDEMLQRFPKLPDWEAGNTQPTFKQLEDYAKSTYTPIGYFFLPEPPEEKIPIPDFRGAGHEVFERPSPNLLETIYICQQRQEWYRDFARVAGEKPLDFVGSAKLTDAPAAIAAKMRKALGFDAAERQKLPTYVEAIRRMIEQADDLGILVMVSGVVLNNNHRGLDPQEFRGFAMADKIAPLVFINGADTKAGQIFTLAHELAHIWLGETALSDSQPTDQSDIEVEKWCNQVAAELLVPLDAMRKAYNSFGKTDDPVSLLARSFKVSTLVIIRRLYDIGVLTRKEMWATYHTERDKLLSVKKLPGGNFYLTQGARLSKRFARAVIVSTFEGNNSFTEAYRMLGVKSTATLRELGQSLGLGV